MACLGELITSRWRTQMAQDLEKQTKRVGIKSELEYSIGTSLYQAGCVIAESSIVRISDSVVLQRTTLLKSEGCHFIPSCPLDLLVSF